MTVQRTPGDVILATETAARPPLRAVDGAEEVVLSDETTSAS
jgi:hypothetical protein